jgi:hypothetical protein
VRCRKFRTPVRIGDSERRVSHPIRNV